MKVATVEEPTTTQTFTLWFEPEEGEDWGELHDQAYSRVTFRPNRLCVLVARSGGQVNAYWSQAREEHSGDGWTNCVGTQACESRYNLAEHLSWWLEAYYEAEKIVRECP